MSVWRYFLRLDISENRQKVLLVAQTASTRAAERLLYDVPGGVVCGRRVYWSKRLFPQVLRAFGASSKLVEAASEMVRRQPGMPVKDKMRVKRELEDRFVDAWMREI